MLTNNSLKRFILSNIAIVFFDRDIVKALGRLRSQGVLFKHYKPSLIRKTGIQPSIKAAILRDIYSVATDVNIVAAVNRHPYLRLIITSSGGGGSSTTTTTTTVSEPTNLLLINSSNDYLVNSNGDRIIIS